MNNKKVSLFTLDNGLKVIIYSDKNSVRYSAKIVTLFSGSDKFFVDSKKNKRRIYAGTAHYLEHYVYENSIYGVMGSNFYKNDVMDCNAFTNALETSFYFNTIHNFEKNLILLIDSVYNPIFSKERIENTKYPVFNEIRESRDKLDNRNYFKKMRFVFGCYEPVVGNISSIKKITCKYLKEVHKYFYVPKNQILAISGNVDVEETLKLVNVIYNKYKFLNNRKRIPYIDSFGVVKKEGTILGGNLNVVDIMYKIDVNRLNSFDKYKLDWYINIFLLGSFSKFFKVNEYLNDNNIIMGNISYRRYYVMGMLIIEISAYTEKKDEFVKNIDNIINNISGFDKKDFELVKKGDRLRVAVRSDNPMDMVEPTIENYVTFDYFGEDTLEFVDTLNYDECILYLSKVDFSNRCIVITKKD